MLGSSHRSDPDTDAWAKPCAGPDRMISDWLARAARTRPDHPYLMTADSVMTFAEADAAASHEAAVLAADIDQGSVVGLMAHNRVPTVIQMFALWRLGATVVLLDPRRHADEFRVQLDLARATKVIDDPGPFDIEVDPTNELPVRPEQEVAWIVFTSGSSGAPRGVELRFASLEASAAASADAVGHRDTDRWLCNLPISHVGGASILIRSAREATTVLLEDGFDPDVTASLLADGRATIASFVAATLAMTLDRLNGVCQGVRAGLIGGGPVTRSLVDRAWDAGIPALPTYGMTETASQIATVPIGASDRMGMEAVAGAEIMVGDDGRILVRGPMVSSRYVGGPSRAPDDWLVTGDLGRIDGMGRLEVLGRVDDVIVTGGENVHPAEVEAELRTCPGVVDVVVVGVPEPNWGAIVAAVYEGTASPAELERHARYRLTGFKVPRRWLPVESLPRLPLGKVDRAAVKPLLT